MKPNEIDSIKQQNKEKIPVSYTHLIKYPVARLDLVVLPDVLLDVLPSLPEGGSCEYDLGLQRIDAAAHCITSSSLRFNGMGL